MKFEKKLMILSGDTKAKGTLSIERNAYGLFATLNVYNLPELRNEGEYRVGLKTAEQVFVKPMGQMGRIMSRFEITDMDIANVHCVVFDTLGQVPILYGTNASQKLWQENLMDGLRVKQESPKKATAIDDLQFSAREESGDIRNYFFDITPNVDRIEAPDFLSNAEESHHLLAVAAQASQEAQYNDAMLAQVNYYAPVSVSPHIHYSGRDKVNENELLNPVDRYLRDQELQEKPPWQEVSTQDFTAYDIVDNAIHKDDMVSNKAPWQYVKEYVQDMRIGYMQKTEEKESSNAQPSTLQTHAVSHTQTALSTESTAPTATSTGAGKTLKNFSLAKEREELSNVETEAAFTVLPVSGYDAGVSALKAMPKADFYSQIKTQLDELFSSGERYTLLEELMPETRWIRVNFDEQKFYVVGLVGTKPNYICYGVPGEYANEAPEELGEHSRWLPLDAKEPEGKGFWLLFQSAVTGEAEV